MFAGVGDPEVPWKSRWIWEYCWGMNWDSQRIRKLTRHGDQLLAEMYRELGPTTLDGWNVVDDDLDVENERDEETIAAADFLVGRGLLKRAEGNAYAMTSFGMRRAERLVLNRRVAHA